jgi:hypothetical protein
MIQIAALAVVNRLPDLLLEAFQHGQAGHDKRTLTSAKVVPDATSAATSAPWPKNGSFSNKSTFSVRALEVVGSAGAHHAAANDDDIRSFGD